MDEYIITEDDISFTPSLSGHKVGDKIPAIITGKNGDKTYLTVFARGAIVFREVIKPIRATKAKEEASNASA